MEIKVNSHFSIKKAEYFIASNNITYYRIVHKDDKISWNFITGGKVDEDIYHELEMAYQKLNKKPEFKIPGSVLFYTADGMAITSLLKNIPLSKMQKNGKFYYQSSIRASEIENNKGEIVEDVFYSGIYCDEVIKNLNASIQIELDEKTTTVKRKDVNHMLTSLGISESVKYRILSDLFKD